jgi:acetoacetate decarboxylase
MSNYNFSGSHFSVNPPPYALPPYQYRNNEMFTIIVKTDPELLRTLVPEPMVPNADARMVIYIGWLHIEKPKQITYGEAGIMVPVTLGDRAGTYMPILYLDEMETLTSGREVWGFPKFRGEVAFNRTETFVEASVSSGGVKIIDAKMDFTKPGEPIPVYDREHFLLKSIPSVTGNGYDLRQINTCKVTGDNRKEILLGDADLKLASSDSDPLGEIPVREIVSSTFTLGDITLSHGEVIHDYLAAGR